MCVVGVAWRAFSEAGELRRLRTLRRGLLFVLGNRIPDLDTPCQHDKKRQEEMLSRLVLLIM